MHSVIGMLAIVGFAYAISSSRQSVAWKTIVIAFAIQFTVGDSPFSPPGEIVP